MKLFLVGLMILSSISAFAESVIIERSISKVGECKLFRTQNKLMTIDRYFLDIELKSKKLETIPQKLNSVKTFSKNLIIGRAIEKAEFTETSTTESFTFNDNGTESPLVLCERFKSAIEQNI